MLWNDLGYTETIYFVTPLSIDTIGKRLLYGRDDEINIFVTDCLNNKRCLKVIGGDVGVGKTSFANVAQYMCFQAENDRYKSSVKYLPSFREIGLSNHDNLSSFSIKAVKTLAINIQSYFSKSGLEIPKSLKEYIDFWTKIKLTISEGGISVGIDILGTGGQLDTQKPVYSYHYPRDPIYTFNNMLKIFLDESDISGVFMLIDNLDTIDKNILINILNQVRDSYFTIDSVYWILVGQRDIGQTIEERSRRLGGYLTGDDISLEHLSPLGFYSAVQERGKVLRITEPHLLDKFIKERGRRLRRNLTEKDIELPLDHTTHIMVYEFVHHELREAFKICNDITIRAQEEILAHGPLTGDHALNYLIEYCDKEVSSVDLSKKNENILSRIYSDNGVSNTSFRLYGYQNAAGFDSLLRAFANRGLLKQSEERGKKRYDPTWKLESLAMCNLLDEECRKLAYGKLTEIGFI